MAAAILIIRYFKGECTPEEALYIEQWAAASPENKLLLEETWRRFNHSTGGESLPGLSIPDAHTEWAKLRPRLSSYSWFSAKLYWIVASVVVVTAVSWFLIARLHTKSISPVAVPPNPAVLPVSPAGSASDTVAVFDFRNTSLEEATQVLGRAYGVRFGFRNPGLLKCRFTTRFDHDPLTYILDVITETLNIHYEYSPDRRTIYLSGAGCE